MANRTCLYICAIGKDDSRERERAEEVVDLLVTPAVRDSFDVMSCHRLDRPGEITVALKSMLRREALVIADLTDSNPNVMYELGLRHAVGLPCIHIAEAGTKLPFDLQNHRTVFYDLRAVTKRKLAVETLQAIVQHTVTSVAPHGPGSPTTLWQEIRSALDPKLPPAEYGSALDAVCAIVRRECHGAQPILRLWGGRGQRDEQDRKLFEFIAQEVGRACARANMAIACTDLEPETLEHWALHGIAAEAPIGTKPVRVYFHFDAARENATQHPNAESKRLLDTRCESIRIPYPFVDSDRLSDVNDEIARERVRGHDSRMGSLLQADAVVLLGGNTSAKHMVQLMAFMERHHIRAAKPLLLIPIPWIAGMGRSCYQEFNGVLDEHEFVTKVTK